MDGASSNPPCRWRGFGGCECNILGACDVHGSPKPGLDMTTLTGYAPYGLEIFSSGDGKSPNLAYICEGNTVAILYDCNKRIPLYAATAMSGDQLNDAYRRPSNPFTKSNDPYLLDQYQQLESDYSPANREICYHNKVRGYLIDYRWYDILNPGKTIGPTFANCHQITGGDKEVQVHKGHLIASSYGRAEGNPTRAKATFTYTNTIPQCGKFNSGQWATFERRLIRWGRDNCATKNTKNVKMYIIVGAIPSTFNGANPRYFGSGGFSDYMDDKLYRINVPSQMWTVACCTFQLQDTCGKWVDGTRHTAFWRENNPGKQPCEKDISKLFGQKAINLFPAAHFSCSDSKNYIPIY